jgi:hypothetical protein
MKEIKYDFFISHASEDKDLFVRPLAKELSKRGYRIWYDEFSLKLGDSLFKGISEGIKQSQYGIIILSKNFFQKNWTKRELEALLNKEIISDDNLILPLWLDIGIKDVYNFSPLLVDKVAVPVKTNEIEKAVNAIEGKIKIQITTKADIRKKIEYLKNCNEDRRNKYFLDLEKRIKSIFLFQQEYYNWYTSDDLFESHDDWDQVLVDLKGKELQKEYEIPNGVWINPEPFPWQEIERAIKLCSKWVFRKLNYQEAVELYFLLEEILDTDVSFVLYGFPHATFKNKKIYADSFQGIQEVGIKDPSKREETEKKHKEAISKVFERYYR